MAFINSASNRGVARLVGKVAAVSTLGLGLTAQSAHAQVPVTCNATPTSANPLDACQKIFDLFRFLTPQIGVALSGGNPMPGETGTLGTPGKSSVVLKVTAVDGVVPENTVNVVNGNPVASDFGAQRAPIPIPTLDAALSLFQGGAVGLTNVGGVDLLLGLTYVPEFEKDRVRIKTDGRGFATSYGLRLGVLQESAAIPGISVSYRKRKLPKTNFSYQSNNDTLAVNSTVVQSSAWRLVAGKHYKFLGLVAGVGRDNLTSRSQFNGTINEPAPVNRLEVSAVLAQEKVKRNTAFFNLSVGLPRAQLVGEMGWSSKGEIQQTVNSFDGRQANDGYRYYSLGFGFRY